jgi:hypothetical protein
MSSFFDRLGIDVGILVVLLMVLVLILIIIVLNQSLLMHRLIRRYHMFMKGSDGMSLEKLMAKNMKEIEHLTNVTTDHELRLRILHDHADQVLSKYGMVKYDAFDDVGGKLSFALALLDYNNTGYILSAIHSRDNCFFYIKEIIEGESYVLLSTEEVEALKKAVNFNEDKRK